MVKVVKVHRYFGVMVFTMLCYVLALHLSLLMAVFVAWVLSCAAVRVTDVGVCHVFCRIAGVYDNLSGHIHQGSRTAVDIVEGPLNKEQMRLLKCIAEEAGARVNMIYRAESVVTSSDESESGVDDSDVPLGSE